MKTLSICIPTLNRKDYLLQALNSILNDSINLERIEICVSNNCCDENYDEVQQLISDRPSVKYIRQPNRISLDENMHECVKMAVGEYVFYLGDDDYFLIGGIELLIKLIDYESPDLAILNAETVNEFSVSTGRLFSGAGLIIEDVKIAYNFYNTKAVYGAVLVKRKHLDESVFKKFYGTSHAYMCFWVSLVIQSQTNPAVPVKVITPEHPIVAVRQAQKTYSDYILDIHYQHMPLWYSLFQEYIMDSEIMKIAIKCEKDNLIKTQGVRFLCSLRLHGINIKNIQNYNSSKFSNTLRFKLTLIKLIPISTLKWIKNINAWLAVP